jgi:hypothetical protein
VKLCDESGRLNPDAVGWSRKPLHACNLKGRWPRKKKWNYWCITSDKFAFSVTVANVDYLALGAAYFIDFETKQLTEWNTAAPLGIGCRMPDGVEENIAFHHPQMKLIFTHVKNLLHIHAAAKKLKADITIEEPAGHETLNVVVPWDRGTFQFTSKQNTLPVSGTVEIGGKAYVFSHDNSFACLDFGRGIWPYRAKWNWSSCSGRDGKDIIGLNLGGMWTDGTGSTENGVCVNGKLYKISEDVKFQYNTKNFMEPWKIFTPDSETVNLAFAPFFEKKSGINLFFLMADTHQMFGAFSGTVKTNESTVKFGNIIGWAEQHISQW